ncbi:MAG: hypothetical protein CML68_05500 [Rhodobacteraceae bacterium]|nr:hypothetical protein [Paracoccaceae bacterium]
MSALFWLSDAKAISSSSEDREIEKYGLDIAPIGFHHERSVLARMLLRAQSRLSVVMASIGEGNMKISLDRFAFSDPKERLEV